MARQDSTLGEGGRKRKWQEPPELSQNTLLENTLSENTFRNNVNRVISFCSTSVEAATIALIACRGNLVQAIKMLEGETSTILREYNKLTFSYPSATTFAILSAIVTSVGSISEAAELLDSDVIPMYTSVTGFVVPEVVDERTIDSVLSFLRGGTSNSNRHRVEWGTVSSPTKSSSRPGLERSFSDSRKRTRGRVSPVKHQRPISLAFNPEFPARTEVKFAIDTNGRARAETFVVEEERKTTRGGPLTNEEWESSQYESSSGDEPILLKHGDMKEQVYAGKERSPSCLPVPSTRESTVQPSGSTASTISADASAQVSLLSNADVLHPPESAVSTSNVDTSAHVLHPPGSDQISLPSSADVIQPVPFVDPLAIISISPIPSTANIPRGPKIPAEENSPVSEAAQGEEGRTAASGEDATYQQPSALFRCDWVTCGKDFATYADLCHHLMHGGCIKELRNIGHDSLRTHDQQLFRCSFCEKRLTSGPDLLSHESSPGRLDQEDSMDLNKVIHPKWRASLVSGRPENSTNLSKVISFKRKPTFISGTCSGLTPMGCGLRSSEYFSLSLYCNLSEYSTKVYSDSSVSISASYSDAYQLKLTPPAIHQEFQLTQLTVPHTGNTQAKFASIRCPVMPVSSFRLTVRIALFNSSLNYWEEISSATSRPVAPHISNPHKITKVSPSNSKNNRAQHYPAQYPQQDQQARYRQWQHHQHHSQHHQSQPRFQHPQEHHSQPQYHRYQQQDQWYAQRHHLQYQQQPPFQYPQEHHFQPHYHHYQHQQPHQQYPQYQPQLQPEPLQPQPHQPQPQPQLQPQHPDPMQLFEQISQNVYTANAKAKKGQDLGLCQCKDEPNSEGHCPEFCTNKVLNIDCDEATCALWDKGCRYSLLSTLPSPNSVVKPFWTGRPEVGWGLRSLCDFKPQQSIIQYTGEVVSKEELDRKAILIRQYLPEIVQERASQEATKYVVDFDGNLFLDAQLKGSLARFINHHPRPNCTMEKHHSKGKLCYVIHAGKEGIKKGDELTLLYSRIHNFENS